MPSNYRMPPAISSNYKILNPCVLNRKSLQFCSGTYQGQQLWTHWSPAATDTPSSKKAGGDRSGGQSLYSGFQETQMQFWLIEIKAIFPQKCSSFYLEAVLGHSVSNWRLLCRLEQAQACVLLSVQGCLGSQGKQKGMSSQPEQRVWLVSTQMPTHRHPVSFKTSLTTVPDFQFLLQKCTSVLEVLCHRISWAKLRVKQVYSSVKLQMFVQVS